MLFTPLLPEAAAGVIETRNVMTPLAMACRHAEVIAGHLTALDVDGRRAEVLTDGGLEIAIEYDHVVLGLGAVPRLFPIPGLTDHAVGFTTVLDALYLRNQLLRLLAAAAVEPDPGYRSRDLTFVFVGGGYAGVEALSELRGLAQDALRYYPALRGVPQRWVLVNAAPQILADIPSRLGRYVADTLIRWGVELRLSTRLVQVADGRVTLSDGTEMDAGLLVWTAGVKANPIVGQLGLPLDERGRVRVTSTLQVDGHPNAWALGDCAAVPNAATPGQLDPPTSQHALRQGRRLAANLLAAQDGRPMQPYRFRSPRPGRHPRPQARNRRPERDPDERPGRLARRPRRPPDAGPRRLQPAAGAQRLGPLAAVPRQHRGLRRAARPAVDIRRSRSPAGDPAPIPVSRRPGSRCRSGQHLLSR